jgi:hypothetical protein
VTLTASTASTESAVRTAIAFLLRTFRDVHLLKR